MVVAAVEASCAEVVNERLKLSPRSRLSLGSLYPSQNEWDKICSHLERGQSPTSCLCWKLNACTSYRYRGKIYRFRRLLYLMLVGDLCPRARVDGCCPHKRLTCVEPTHFYVYSFPLPVESQWTVLGVQDFQQPHRRLPVLSTTHSSPLQKRETRDEDQEQHEDIDDSQSTITHVSDSIASGDFEEDYFEYMDSEGEQDHDQYYPWDDDCTHPPPPPFPVYPSSPEPASFHNITPRHIQPQSQQQRESESESESVAVVQTESQQLISFFSFFTANVKRKLSQSSSSSSSSYSSSASCTTHRSRKRLKQGEEPEQLHSTHEQTE